MPSRCPLPEPLRVDVGVRSLKVTKPGYKDFTDTRTVEGGTEAHLDVKLVQVVHEGRLRVVTDPDARIAVDGKLVGRGTWEGKLPSGPHSLRVEASGRKPYESDVAIVDDQTSTSRVALESNQPQQAAPSGGLPAWVWAVGGGVLAAGLATGGYFLLRPGTEAAPPPTAGTMDPGTLHIQLFR